MDLTSQTNALPNLNPKCGLCEQPNDLRMSHVLPAFVYRWLRETSITGHIRSVRTINQRTQDGDKKPWFCAECEQLIGKDETAFASKVFHPWLAGNNQISYQSWLIRFCTSVSWRVLKHVKDMNPEHQYTATEEKLAAKADQVWRDFLLGRRSTVGKFEQHLLPLDVIESTTIPDLPSNINRYLSRNIEMDIIGGAGTFMTYAKLGGFAIFGMMRPPRRWEGTRIYGQQGRLEPRRYSVPGALMWYFIERAQLSKNALTGMSPRQLSKVDAAIIDNIDHEAKTPHLRALMADVAMFGEEAVLRKK